MRTVRGGSFHGALSQGKRSRDSLILAQREAHYPITKAIYVLFERLGDGQYIASAMGVWGMALLGVTLVGASVMMGKKMGAIFRV